ncbi:MAG: undecaprenyl-diphosphate phosphatase, partial [Patescibacteria group bacterium]
YKLLELLYSENVGSLGTPIIFGSIFSFIFGLLSVHYLLQILKKHTLNVFIVYRLLLAVVVAIVFL